MNYLLTPLHTHFDGGFGATGNAFKQAADRLFGDASRPPFRSSSGTGTKVAA
jgi:hypothetical protein